MGMQPDVSYLWLANDSPRWPISFYRGSPDPALFAGNEPIKRYESSAAPPIELWRAAPGSLDSQVFPSDFYWLVYRLASWTVLAPVEQVDQADQVAHALQPWASTDGFVAADAVPPIGLSPDPGDGGGPSLTMGDTDPRPIHVRTAQNSRLVILWPSYSG